MPNKIFLWNHYHNGDIIFTKPVVWRLLMLYPDIEIAWGVFHNHAYLLSDLPIQVLSDSRSDDNPIDLNHLCPSGFASICMWLGQYEDTKRHTWENVVRVFNRQAAARSIDTRIPEALIPFVTFRWTNVSLRPNPIYIENGSTRSGHSSYQFHMDKIGEAFPMLNFYCTANPETDRDNVFDCSCYNLRELASLSQYCDAILGKGSGPFCCTVTEANRYKPKVIMDYHSPNGPTFYDYPDNPIRYLSNDGELFAFLQEMVDLPKLKMFDRCHNGRVVYN